MSRCSWKSWSILWCVPLLAAFAACGPSGSVASVEEGNGGGGNGGSGKGGAAGSGSGGAAGVTGGGGAGTPGMSARCGKAPTIASSMYNNGNPISITAANLQRRYILSVPTNYDNTKAYKLVV